jgi:hypothetical protein
MQFRGLNTTPNPTDIGNNEAVSAVNTDLTEGIGYLAYPTDFVKTVKFSGATFVTNATGYILQGGTSFYEEAPSNPVTVAEKTEGSNPLETNTYDFIMTFKNSDGYETQGSVNTTHTLTATDKKLRINWDTGIVPSGWDVLLYARGNESYQAEYSLLKRIETTDPEYSNGYWTWDAQTDLDPENGIYTSDDNATPVTYPSIMHFHNSIFFLAKDKYVYYSKIAEPNAFPTEQRFTFDDTVTGLTSASGELIVSTQEHIYRIIGTNPDNFQKVTTAVKKGCYHNGTFITVGGNVVYYSDDGLYEFNGAKEQKLSEKVNAQFENISSGTDAIFDGRYYQTNNTYNNLTLDIIRGNYLTWDTNTRWTYKTKEFLYDMLPHQADRILVDYSGTIGLNVYFDGVSQGTYTFTNASRPDIPELTYLPKGRFERIQLEFNSNGTTDTLYQWKFYGGE